MDNLFGFVEAFYSRFILRDLLAKITPGMILLTTITYIVNDGFPLNINISFVIGVFVVSFAWIIGFAIQGLGELTRTIRYHKNKESKENYWKYMQQLEKNGKNNDKDLERIVVIKETCGNASLSIFLSGILLVLYICLVDMPSDTTLIKLVPVFVLYIILLVSLYSMHLKHVLRQDDLVSQRLEN